jgi:hypothetical protein
MDPTGREGVGAGAGASPTPGAAPAPACGSVVTSHDGSHCAKDPRSTSTSKRARTSHGGAGAPGEAPGEGDPAPAVGPEEEAGQGEGVGLRGAKHAASDAGRVPYTRTTTTRASLAWAGREGPAGSATTRDRQEGLGVCWAVSLRNATTPSVEGSRETAGQGRG